MEIKIKKLHPDAIIPKVMTEGAACFDIFAVTCATGYFNNQYFATVETGLAFEIPKNYKLVIVPRSSFCHKGWVMQNSPAQIDSDYRGQLILKFQAIPQEILKHTYPVWNSNLGTNIDMEKIGGFLYTDFPYSHGERVAQGYIERVIQPTFVEVEELSETIRGDGGFGSTGVK